MEQVKKIIGNYFKVKDMGDLSYFLSVKVVQNKQKCSIWIGQPLYTETVLKKFNTDKAKAAKTPVKASQKLINN